MCSAQTVVKSVLESKVEQGTTWEQAYGQLIGAYEQSVDELGTQSMALKKELEEAGEPTSYIRARLDAFAIATDREMFLLHMARQLQAQEWRGGGQRTRRRYMAAMRLDFSAWLKNLSHCVRTIAKTLATGEWTGVVARQFWVTSGRISQLRCELREFDDEAKRRSLDTMNSTRRERILAGLKTLWVWLRKHWLGVGGICLGITGIAVTVCFAVSQSTREDVKTGDENLRRQIKELRFRVEEVRAILLNPSSPSTTPRGDALTEQAGEIADLLRRVTENKQAKHLPPSDVLDLRRARNIVSKLLYRIHSPDILQIEALHTAPKGPYRLRVLDSISINAVGTLPDSPISGVYQIEPGGNLNLGLPYGQVIVAGLTPQETQKAIDQHLRTFLREPDVSIALAQISAPQRIVGQFLVTPDGTITLGSYGSVFIEGLTVAQAKQAIENHLATYLDDPVISVSVAGFNSMKYYISIRDPLTGDKVQFFPFTGNETVLDAISALTAIPPVHKMEIHTEGFPGTLTVDWESIQSGDLLTNYRVLGGDHIVVYAKSTDQTGSLALSIGLSVICVLVAIAFLIWIWMRRNRSATQQDSTGEIQASR